MRHMKFLLLAILSFGFICPSIAVTTKMFKVLDTCARYRLKEKSSFEAIRDLNLKYDGNDLEESELFIKLYCSVFIPNEKVDF